MNLTINAVKFKADKQLEEFVTNKVSKLDRLIDNATKCEVYLKLDRPESDFNKKAELSIALPGQTLFTGSKNYNTFEEAITECVDTMKVQIEKYKEKNK